MSNTPNISRDSAKPEKVRNLTPSGYPKAKTAKLQTGGRDPRAKRR